MTNRSFSILIIFILFGIIGLCLGPLISIQLLPSRSYNSITISAQLPGSTSETTELELTNPIEGVISRMKGVIHITSSSSPGSCNVKVQLDKWTDPDAFRFEASVILRQLSSLLPPNASYPLIYLNKPDEFNQNQPVLVYTLSGLGSINEIAGTAEQEFRPIIASIKGVNRFEISGKELTNTYIDLDQHVIQSINLTIQDIQKSLTETFQNKGLGQVSVEGKIISIAIKNGIDKLKDIASIPIKNYEGRLIQISDIGSIKHEKIPKSNYYRINGLDQVTLSIYPKENVNTILLVNNIKEKFESHVKKNLSNKQVLTVQFDSTEYIKEELKKIYIRTALSVGILFLFIIMITRQIRYILIVFFSLVINILLSLIFYYLIKLEVHLYSLAGITLSLGLIIDNVIVIIDDIRVTNKNRIFAAILASTLTALGALSVIFLLEEDFRVLLLDFAVAIIINLAVSLPIAYFFIPALLNLFPIKKKQSSTRYNRKRLFSILRKQHENQLNFMLKYRWAFISLFILGFGIPVFLLPITINNNPLSGVYNNTLGSDFYNKNLRPKINRYLGGILWFYIDSNNESQNLQTNIDERTELNVNISMPGGATIEQMNTVCNDFENFIKPYMQEIEVFTTWIPNCNKARISIILKKGHTTAFPYQLKQMLEDLASQSGSADFSIFGMGKGFNNKVNFEQFDSSISISGYNYKQLRSLAQQIRDKLQESPRVQNIMIGSSEYSNRQLSFENIINIRNPEYLAFYNINYQNLSSSLINISSQSTEIGRLSDGSVVNLRVNAESLPSIWNVMNEPLNSNDHKSIIHLSNTAEVEKTRINEEIVKENQEYFLYINYQFLGLPKTNNELQKEIIEFVKPRLPFGYSVSIPSHNSNVHDQAKDSLWFIPLVLLIIYMICAILLESLSKPFAVILMIPFSFIGVFLIFSLLNLKFDQGGYAALLMLSGIVTNAALYIINDFNFITKPGKNKTPSVKMFVKAFNLKAMPIIITTVSAILSLLPFMLIGEEKGFWFTLSAGTIGGGLFSLIGAYWALPLFMLSKLKDND